MTPDPELADAYVANRLLASAERIFALIGSADLTDLRSDELDVVSDCLIVAIFTASTIQRAVRSNLSPSAATFPRIRRLHESAVQRRVMYR